MSVVFPSPRSRPVHYARVNQGQASNLFKVARRHERLHGLAYFISNLNALPPNFLIWIERRQRTAHRINEPIAELSDHK